MPPVVPRSRFFVLGCGLNNFFMGAHLAWKIPFARVNGIWSCLIGCVTLVFSAYDTLYNTLKRLPHETRGRLEFGKMVITVLLIGGLIPSQTYLRSLKTLVEEHWDDDCSSFCFKDYAAELRLNKTELHIELEPTAYALPMSSLIALFSFAFRAYMATNGNNSHIKTRRAAAIEMGTNESLMYSQDMAKVKVKEAEEFNKKVLSRRK